MVRVTINKLAMTYGSEPMAQAQVDGVITQTRLCWVENRDSQLPSYLAIN